MSGPIRPDQPTTTNDPEAPEPPTQPEAEAPPAPTEPAENEQAPASDAPPSDPAEDEQAPTADAPPSDPPKDEQAPAAADEAVPEQPASDAQAEPTEPKPDAADQAAEQPPPDAAAEQTAGQPKSEQPKKKKKPKPEGPSVGQVVGRVGSTTEQALAYVRSPDPKLSRLSRKVREALLADLPAVTAGALLGPAALARHLVASAATGRYRDLFALWDLFRAFPEECKPVLAERQAALGRAQQHLRTATRIGIRGEAKRVAEDVARAEGLIWQWLREILGEVLPAVGCRPEIAAALLRREPDAPVPIPAQPEPRWLAEAAAARGDDPLPQAMEETLASNVHRLPATVETLRLATRHYPDRVSALVDRVDLDAPDVGAFLAWARDHGAADRLYGRIRDRVSAAAARDRARGLELWHAWMQRGVEVPLPDALQIDSLEDFDLSRPETSAFAARLIARGVELDVQAELEQIAARNRQLAEKAYEAMVCAGLDVHLPKSLEDNPIVKEGTRCPNCQAWTWVRPGHEERCPRPPAPPKDPEPDPFSLAAAEVTQADRS